MNITGMIFAAGLGTRLRPITLTTPKPLVQINDKPIIEYQIDWFIQLGINEIFINSHYLPEQFNYLPEKYKTTCKIILLREDEILGHGGTLMKVKKLASFDQILTCNADTIITIPSIEISRLVNLDNAITLYNLEIDTLGFNSKNELIRIRETVLKDNKEVVSGDFAGVAVFSKRYLSLCEYPEGFLGLFGEGDILEETAKKGKFVKGFVPKEMKRFEITVPSDIEAVSKLILKT